MPISFWLRPLSMRPSGLFSSSFPPWAGPAAGKNPGKSWCKPTCPTTTRSLQPCAAITSRFYQEEIKFRKLLRYPPFSRLLRILVSGKRAEVQAGKMAEMLREKGLEVLGPARLHPLRGEPRFQVLLRGDSSLPRRVRALFPKLPQNVRVEPDPLWLG